MGEPVECRAKNAPARRRSRPKAVEVRAGLVRGSEVMGPELKERGRELRLESGASPVSSLSFIYLTGTRIRDIKRRKPGIQFVNLKEKTKSSDAYK